MPIDRNAFFSEMNACFSENGFSSLLSKQKNDKFLLLTEHLLRENEKYNLTAITDPSEIVFRHYVDCAPLARLLPKGAQVIDVGCGAGFPTLPLALLREDVTVTAVDSTEKKVRFVGECAKLLGLTNVRTRTARAEDLGHDDAFREKFDVAVSRAVAAMRLLVELCLPLVRVGGRMIAMKGKNAIFEAREAKRGISLLGGKLAEGDILTLKYRGEVFERPLLTVDKISRTPTAYPRAYAQISKKPL